MPTLQVNLRRDQEHRQTGCEVLEYEMPEGFNKRLYDKIKDK